MSTGRLSSRLVAHPVVVASVAVLVVNDHVLKARFPGIVTGKLSDVAGMIFFPALLLWMLEGAVPRSRALGERLLVGCALATALGLAWVKADPTGTELYRCGLGWLQWPWRALGALARAHPLPAVGKVAAVTDRSDLLALPFAAVTPILARAARMNSSLKDRRSRRLPAGLSFTRRAPDRS